MTSTDFRPAKCRDFNAGGEGLIQDRLPIVKTGMLEGREDNPNNIVILVGPTEQKFVVNKCLAKLSSPLLEKSIKGARESNEAIKFPEIFPKQFQTVLECAIVGMKWTITNMQDVCRLIETSAHFELYDFIEIICGSVFREVQTGDDLFDDKENLEIFMFQSLGFESVRRLALDYIMEHASSILQRINFGHLSLEDLGEILIQDKLKIESEVEVWNALIRWGMNTLKNESKLASPENLGNVLAEPLNWIRFPNMNEREFRDYVIPLQILMNQQINLLESWYNGDGSISSFNCHPRKYLKVKDAKPAVNHPKSYEELLHTTRMDKLIAKFNMNIQLHNAEIEAENSKTLARALEYKNLELESKVQRMESLFEWDKIFDANRFCHKLEALRKFYVSSPTNTTGSQNNPIDSNLLKQVADKIHKGEDLTELVPEIKEPKKLDLRLFESLNETIVTKIGELQRVKCNEIYEQLLWKIFQRETNSTVVELQKFPNTQTFASVIIFKNNTPDTLRNFQNFNWKDPVYIAIPSNIQPFCTHNYGQTTSDTLTAGVLSYDIGSIRIVIRHDFEHNYNDFGIAFAPLTFPVNKTGGYEAFTKEDWTNDSTKIKALCKSPKELEKCIKLGNLCLHAELIGTGPKAILRVLVTDM